MKFEGPTYAGGTAKCEALGADEAALSPVNEKHCSKFILLAWVLMTGLTFGKQLQESEGHSKLLYILYCLCIHVE